jgi:hypothetical protein
MTQPQPAKTAQPTAGTTTAAPRRARTRVPAWASKPPVVLTIVGLVAIVELGAYFLLGLLWWAIANAVVALLIWLALLAWRRKGKGGLLDRILNAIWPNRSSRTSSSRSSGLGKSGRAGGLSRLFGGRSGGAGRSGGLGKLLGKGRGGLKGVGGRGSKGGSPLGKPGGKSGPGNGRSSGRSWWPFTRTFSGGAGKSGKGGSAGGKHGKRTGSGSTKNGQGKSGSGKSGSVGGIRGWLDGVKGEFKKGADTANRIIGKRGTGDSYDYVDDDSELEDDDGVFESEDDDTGATSEPSASETGSGGGTMARKGRIYSAEISLQGFGRHSLPAISAAIEADAAAAQKVARYREEVAAELAKATAQAESELPLDPSITAELQAIQKEFQQIADETDALNKRAGKLKAQADTLPVQYRRRHEHDEQRVDGGRGHSRKKEERADVSRASGDV